MWRVIIIEFATGDVVQKLKAKSLREAEKIERGVLINLNTDDFGTDIEEYESEDE